MTEPTTKSVLPERWSAPLEDDDYEPFSTATITGFPSIALVHPRYRVRVRNPAVIGQRKWPHGGAGQLPEMYRITSLTLNGAEFSIGPGPSLCSCCAKIVVGLGGTGGGLRSGGRNFGGASGGGCFGGPAEVDGTRGGGGTEGG